MVVRQYEALTLRTYPYSDSHKIAVFLTRELGRIRGIAHGASSSKSRFGSSLEPLTQVRLTFSRKENQELAVIRNCEIIRAFPAFELSWEVNLHFSYFAELLMEFSREQVESDSVFRLALAVLEAVDTVPVSRLARYIEVWLLRLEGILPWQNLPLEADLAGKLGEMMRLHPTRLGEVEVSEADIRSLEEFSVRLIEGHLERPLKTRRMIRDLL